LLANNREIRKYTTELLNNGFTNKHVPMATTEIQPRGTVFSALSMPRCYKRDKRELELMQCRAGK
jgi:hypothetical protein